jgi:hypothetical protein
MGGRKTRLAADFRDLLRVFVAHDVRFLVVGAYALAVLGRPRATGDLDVWIDATPENAERTIAALREFGAPLHDLRVADLARPGVVFQIGLPPLRIDVLTLIDGVAFANAWARRITADFEDVRVAVISRRDFLANKRATGRLISERHDASGRCVKSDPTKIRSWPPSRRSRDASRAHTTPRTPNSRTQKRIAPRSASHAVIRSGGSERTRWRRTRP